VELVSPDAPARHETRFFEHLEVLRDRLPGEVQVALHGQPLANFEEGLTVPVDQFIEDRSPRRRRQGMEDINHIWVDDRQVTTCLSSRVARSLISAGPANPSCQVASRWVSISMTCSMRRARASSCLVWWMR
jgi:hypothetical protein